MRPSGPFQTTVLHMAEAFLDLLHGCRTEIEDHFIRRHGTDRHGFDGNAFLERRRRDRIFRQHDMATALLGLGRLPAPARTYPARKAICRSSMPLAARNVFAMPPPRTSMSTLSMRFFSSSSLVEIFEPPTMAANGRSGLSSALVSAWSSSCMARPAADGRSLVMPSVEAWAR